MIGLMMLVAVSALTPSDVVTIRRSCRVPSSWLRYQADKSVRFSPPPGAADKKVECVLTGLRKGQPAKALLVP
jgi:hypothetical protein